MCADFLPIFLSNIPYNMTQLYVVYVDCYYVSIAIMSAMVALVVASFFVRWTKLPTNPTTVAGAMYYVVDSNLLRELADRGEDDDEDSAEEPRKPGLVMSKGVSVRCGLMKGVSGLHRTQVGITNLSV